MTDLVITSLEPWDEVWRRNQHLIAGLMRTDVVSRVLFVEPAPDPFHAVRRRERPQKGTGLRTISDVPGIDPGRLWAYQPTKWLPRRLDKSADTRWAKGVQRTATRIGMTEPVLWVNDPMGAALLGETSWRSLYDITDDWLLADRTPLTIERLKRQEAELFARCQAVVVCSEGLLRTKSTLRDVILIPNGVDLEPYHVMQDRPEDLPAGRVALYLGTAHQDRFDTAICARTAALLASDESSRPSATVVLIGPAPLPTSDLVTLRDAGAHVLGPRPSHLVPAYLQHADVLLVPHVLTDFTASLDPIKAYEYRAARRPVVATLVPGFSDTSDPLVRAVHGEDFPTTVADVLTQQVPWSSDLPDDIPSWRSRVDQMAAVVRLTADGGRVP